MTSIENDETKTFAVPIEGLFTPRIFSIGPVTIFPSVEDLQHMKPERLDDEFDRLIARPGDAYRAVAVVEGTTIENALKTIEQALNVFRVFQYGLMRVAHYSHFGIPGEIHTATISFFYKGSTGSGMGFKVVGLHRGFELQEAGIDSWENHATSLQFAARAIDAVDASESAERSLNGVQLFSQSILVKDPDLRVLLVIAALEGMLKPQGERSRTLSLARKLSFLSCWGTGACGQIEGQPCPYVLFNPVVEEDRKLLLKLRQLSSEDFRWKCTYWEVINTWYETRSGIAHGNAEGTDPSEAANFAYWAYHQYLGPTLTWLMENEHSPIEELETRLAELKSDVIDWREVVKTGVMPDSTRKTT